MWVVTEKKVILCLLIASVNGMTNHMSKTLWPPRFKTEFCRAPWGPCYHCESSLLNKQRQWCVKYETRWPLNQLPIFFIHGCAVFIFASLEASGTKELWRSPAPGEAGELTECGEVCSYKSREIVPPWNKLVPGGECGLSLLYKHWTELSCISKVVCFYVWKTDLPPGKHFMRLK